MELNFIMKIIRGAKIMKKNILSNVIILSTLLVVLLSIVLIFCFCAVSAFIGISQVNNQETFISYSQSPDGKYILEAYKTEPGATVDFSIKVYLIKGENKKLIYNAYHEEQVQIIWIDNQNVSINNKILDLSIGETYDWRTQ